jgi:hypothetical protein
MDDKQYELYIRPFVDHYSVHQWLADTYSMSLDNCTQDNAACYFLFLIEEVKASYSTVGAVSKQTSESAFFYFKYLIFKK